jgi:hypothetical protein
MIPIFAEDADVVHKTFELLDSTEYRFHGFLSKIGRALDTHRQSAISVLAEGCYDGTQVLGLVVKLERVELHSNIELGEEGVARTLGEDVLDARKRIDASVNDFVEGAEVGYDSNATIFLWDGECRSCPIGCSTWFKDTDLDKSVDLVSKHLLVVVGD